MTTLSSRWLVTASFAGLALGCASPPSPASPTVTAGQSVLGVVRFPEVWIVRREGLIIYGRFEVRHAESPGGEELFFGVRSVDGRLSDNHVAVSTDGRFLVRAASADDWRRAPSTARYARNVMYDDGWRGANLRHTGVSLRYAMPSPDGTMLALLSITDIEKPSLGVLPQGRYRGTAYLDVYNVAAGERVAAAQSDYSGASGSMGFAEAAWIENRAFVVPLDPYEHTCFVLVLPGRSFSRVTPPVTAFVSFSDAGADDDANGLIDRVVVTANVNAQTAGRYQFGVTLEAANGATTKASTIATLPSGPTTLAVSFDADDVRRLGVDGPYTLKDAILVYLDDPGLLADARAIAGSTAKYLAASLDPGEVPDGGPDVTPPVIESVANLTAHATSDAGVVVTFNLPDVMDNIDLAPNVSAKPSPGSQFRKGVTTVTVTATDAARNSSTRTFTVNVLPWLKCDADGDGRVTAADLAIIRNASGQPASGPDDARDGNNDGAINIADVGYCQRRLTP